MCINFETSLISFLIGELSGLTLILFNYCKTDVKSNDYEKIFIYVSTFIKFYQASEYISDDCIKHFLSSYWNNLNCAEMLLSLS